MTTVNVTEAKLKTLSVEISSLTVSGKQMTLSVFRQLKNESVIDPVTFRFVGKPWGSVNYYFDECKNCKPQQHIHVVWQKDNELRRACVEKWDRSPILVQSDIDEIYTFVYGTILSKNFKIFEGGEKFLREKHQYLYKYDVDAKTYVPNFQELAVVLKSTIANVEYFCALSGFTEDQLIENPKGAIQAIRDEQEKRRIKYDDCFNLLKELPQLFIAL